jgi:Ca2+-binding EF-hand superfamily protein
MNMSRTIAAVPGPAPRLACLLLLLAAVCAGREPQAPADYMSEFLGGGPAYGHHRFRAAAGADMIMHREEFVADQEREGGAHFVRPFDTWAALLRWDADRDEDIDWIEAARYRVDQAVRLADAFELQGDGRWDPAERARANAALADGRVPGEPPKLTRHQARACRKFLQDALRNERHIAIKQNLEPCDRNRDGVVTRAEAVRSMVADARHFSGGAEAKRADATATFNWWDSDEDGRVSRLEIQCAHAMRAARTARAFASRLVRTDEDGDGRISPSERRAHRERAMLAQFDEQDENDDGRLSAEEAIVLTNHVGANEAARRAFRRKDADGDGYVTRAEALAHFRKGR